MVRPEPARASISLALLTLEGASVALAFSVLRLERPRTTTLIADRLPVSLQALPAAVGAVSGLLVGLVLLLGRRGAVVHRLPRRLAPLLMAWLLPALWDYRLWKDHELPFLLLCALLPLGLQPLTRLAFETEPVFPGLRVRVSDFLTQGAVTRRRPWAPLLIVLIGTGIYAAFFSYFTIRNHYRLGTASLDMGLENNLVWNAMRWTPPLFKSSPLGGPDTSHGGFHQTYLSYLLALPYRLAPGPPILLAMQSIMMGGAAIPLYLLCRRTLGPWTSCLVSVMFLLYPPLHGANLYDFHYLPLATFFLWLTLWLLQSRRYVWGAVAVVLTLAVREDVSALLAVVGAILLFTGERPLAGLLCGVTGAVYFVCVKLIIMPRFLGGTESFIHQYAELLPRGEGGFGGVLKTVFANPAFTLETLLERDKLIYFLKIATPLAFFPWRRPIGLLCTVPGFLFTLLSTKYPPLIQTSFQYTAYWTTFLFIAIALNLSWYSRNEHAEPERAREWRASRSAWLVTMAVCCLVTSYQFGALFQQHTVVGGFSRYRFDLTKEDRARHARLYELIAQVPPDAKIVSSENIVPQVSNRPDSYTMRIGVFDADYMLVWMPPRADERRSLEDLKDGTFGVVDVRGEFVLAKRGHSTEKNQEVISRFRL